MKVWTKAAILLGIVALLTTPLLAGDPAAENVVQDQEVVFGYDAFDDIRLAINHQTGSDLTVYSDEVVIDTDGSRSSQFLGEVTWAPWVRWWSVVNPDIEQPTTSSFYVDDSFELDESFSFDVDDAE